MQLFSHSKLEKRSYLRMHPFSLDIAKILHCIFIKRFSANQKVYHARGRWKLHYTGTYHQCFHNLLSTLLRVGRCARQSANLCAHPISADCYLVYNSYTNYSTGYHKLPGFPSVFTTAFYNRHCPTYAFPDSSLKPSLRFKVVSFSECSLNRTFQNAKDAFC